MRTKCVSSANPFNTLNEPLPQNASAGQFQKARAKLNRFLSLVVAVFRRTLLLPRRIILLSVVSKRDESTDFD